MNLDLGKVPKADFSRGERHRAWVKVLAQGMNEPRKPDVEVEEIEICDQDMLDHDPSFFFDRSRIVGAFCSGIGTLVFTVEALPKSIAKVRDFVLKLSKAERQEDVPYYLFRSLQEASDPELRAYLLQLLDQYARPKESEG